MMHLFPLGFSVFVHKDWYKCSFRIFSSKILCFLDYVLNIMVIPQMEICSFHFQKMLEVLLLCTKLRVEKILKDEAEESQEKEFF